MPYMPTDTECSELNPGICGKDATPTMIDNCNSIHIDGIDDVTINQGVGIDLTDGVKAYDSTGAEIPFEVHPEEIDKCEVGEHKVTYSAIGADEKLLPSLCGDNFVEITCSGLSKLIKNRLVTITQANPPTINGIDDVVMDTGEPFNPMDGVTGVDDNGNPLDVSYSGIYDVYAEGDIASFETDINEPFRSLKVNIEPVQDLHGYDKPWVGGSHYNQWDEQWEQGVLAWNGSVSDDGSTRIRSKNFVPCVAGNEYRVVTSENLQFFYYDSSKALVSYEPTSKTNGSSITIPTGCSYLKFYTYRTSYGATYKNDIAINYPSTVITYSPWENLCPITGWTGCEVDVAGVNLFDADRTLGTPSPADGSNTTSPRVMDVTKYYVGLRPNNWYYPSNIADYSVSNGSVYVKASNNAYGIGFPVAIKPNEQYTISGVASANPYLGVGFYDKTWHYISSGNSQTATFTFTAPTNAYYAVIVLRSTDTSVGYTWSNIQVNVGVTASTYEEYNHNSAVYPVSWQTEAGTVYGGTVDLVTGVLTVDRKLVNIDPSTVRINAVVTGGGRYIVTTTDAKDVQTSDPIAYTSCNTLKSITSDSIEIGGSSLISSKRLSFMLPVSTEAEARQWFTDNPTTVVYPLAQAQTYQLDPVQVACLLGQNNVWVDCGDVYVEYSKTIPSSGNITYPLNGIYSIIYSATDQCGNHTEEPRILYVGDICAIVDIAITDDSEVCDDECAITGMAVTGNDFVCNDENAIIG